MGHSSVKNKNVIECPQPFTVGRLQDMSFLCRSGCFIQFLAKMFSLRIDPPPHGVEFNEHDFYVQIWRFYAMTRKKIVNWHPPYPPWGWNLVNMSFLYRSGSFVQKQLWGELTPPHHLSNEGGVWQPFFFPRGLNISFNFCQTLLRGNYSPIPPWWGGGLVSMTLLCRSRHWIHPNFFFSNRSLHPSLHP